MPFSKQLTWQGPVHTWCNVLEILISPYDFVVIVFVTLISYTNFLSPSLLKSSLTWIYFVVTNLQIVGSLIALETTRHYWRISKPCKLAKKVAIWKGDTPLQWFLFWYTSLISFVVFYLFLLCSRGLIGSQFSNFE